MGVGLPLTVLEASISTLFVSFAEIPDSLSHCHPIVYLRCVARMPMAGSCCRLMQAVTVVCGQPAQLCTHLGAAALSKNAR